MAIPKKNGFTLIELILVIGIFTILITLVTVNMLRPQTTTPVNQAVSVLIADIKQQQLKSMLGDTGGTETAQSFGVYFGIDKYILFKGSSYSPADPDNFTVELGEGLQFTDVTLPSDQVVFLRRSGEVSGYSTELDSLTITHTQGGVGETLITNRYGVLTRN